MPRIAPILLRTEADARKAIRWVQGALKAGGYVVAFRKEKRTDDQNAKMWAMLEEIFRARPMWNGVPMSKERWKGTFLDALGVEQDYTPRLDGPGLVPIGQRSSELTKQEFSDLIEIMNGFAAREGIELSEPQQDMKG